MKKFYSMMMVMMAMMTIFTFTSCDDDVEMASTLEGTWEGDMQVYRDYNGRRYEAVWSKICFEGDPFRWTRGTGYWLDYYRNSPWKRDYVASHIEWHVDNRVLYVYFVEDAHRIEIRDYRLTDYRFRGTIYDDGQTIDFNLKHVSSPKWDDYDYDYSYDYYAKGVTIDGTRAADSTATKIPMRKFGK